MHAHTYIYGISIGFLKYKKVYKFKSFWFHVEIMAFGSFMWGSGCFLNEGFHFKKAAFCTLTAELDLSYLEIEINLLVSTI